MANPDPMAGWIEAMRQMNKPVTVNHQCKWWSVLFQEREYCKTNATVRYDEQWWCVKHSKLVTKGGVRSG